MSIMLIFSAQLCELLPLNLPSLHPPPPSQSQCTLVQYIQRVCGGGEGGVELCWRLY